MAQLTCNFFSDALGLSTSMTVLLPEQTHGQIGMTGAAPTTDGFPTLYLLHGLSDDHTIWLRRTSIERYIAPLGLAVVMPAVQRSFYTDEAYGLRYWTFLSEELPAKAESMFRLATDPRLRYVAGLSMGGYGALKWALRQPRRFAAAASLSGAVDVGRLLRLERDDNDPRIAERLFGSRPGRAQPGGLPSGDPRAGEAQPGGVGSAAQSGVDGTDDDLFALLSAVPYPPPLYLCCGTEDPLIDDNRRFEQACRAAGVPIESSFDAGAHDWEYWDRRIQDVLSWLPLPSAGAPTTEPVGPTR